MTRELPSARVLVAPGAAFWYENANGLAEIAVNRGSTARTLGLSVGSIRRHCLVDCPKQKSPFMTLFPTP